MTDANKREADIVVQLLSHVQLFATPWAAACQASLSFAVSQSLLKLVIIESVMLSNHLILCHPLLLLPSIFPSIRVFSSELALHIRCPKYWNFSLSISLSSEYSGRIFFSMHWFALLAVQATLKSLLQHHRHQYFGALPSLWSNSPSVHDYWKDHCLDYMDLCQQGDVFAF